MKAIAAIQEAGSAANGPVRSLDAGTLEATHQELRAGTAIFKRVFSVSLD